MKFLVDEMPKESSHCPWSEWECTYDVYRNSGRYMCRVDKRPCDFSGGPKCRWLKEDKDECCN